MKYFTKGSHAKSVTIYARTLGGWDLATAMALSAFLKKSRFFSNLAEADLDSLETSMLRRRYSAGQMIFHMGDEGGSLYIIARGRVKVLIPSPLGEEVILAILSRGEILGELSLIDGKPRSASAEAIEATELFCLQKKAFLNFLRSCADSALPVLEILSQRLRETDALLADAHFLDIRSRLAKKILDLARVFGIRQEDRIRIGIRVTQKDLASMVGATRESVNKQFMQLQQLGLVQLTKRHIVILDPVRLARRAWVDLPEMTNLSTDKTD